MAQFPLNGISIRSIPALAALLLMSLGCSGEASTGNTATSGGSDRAEKDVTPSQSTANARDDAVLDESDRLSLQAAAAACNSRDPNAFFDAFIQSKAVQKKYTAPSIEFVRLRADFTVDSWEEVKAAEYKEFPIEMVDYYRKSAHPLQPDSDEHVVIDLNQGQNEALVVEWTRVTYDGKSSGGDDLGTAFTLDGRAHQPGDPSTDGQLFFAATTDCWRLETDTRHYRSYLVK